MSVTVEVYDLAKAPDPENPNYKDLDSFELEVPTFSEVPALGDFLMRHEPGGYVRWRVEAREWAPMPDKTMKVWLYARRIPVQ